MFMNCPWSTGLRRVPADASRLLVQEPVKALKVTSNVLRVALGDDTGGQAHSLDGAPADLRVRIERRRNEAAQDPLLAQCQVGDLFQTPLVKQLAQGFFHR